MSRGVVAIIPARWDSVRFPGKPLHPIAGKPLVQHVWERCGRCRRLCGVAIATDDERIREAAEGFGARVCMTSREHPSGTDRLAEAIGEFPEATHAINVQGDEPLIEPDLIDELASLLAADSSLPMVTAAHELRNPREGRDPNVVKVVFDRAGHALYFSRSAIPYAREGEPAIYRHLGIYGYAREFLLRFVRWSPTPLELAERLEQLRALENGARIRVILTGHAAVGVDTPEQARDVESLILRGEKTP